MTFTLFESLTLTESEKKRRLEKAFWGQRFIDPMIAMRWAAMIQVIPAGGTIGTRIYPDGTRERFYV